MSPPPSPRPLLPSSHPSPRSLPSPLHPHPPRTTSPFSPGIVTRRRLLLLSLLLAGSLISLLLAGETLYRPPRIPDLPIPKELPHGGSYLPHAPDELDVLRGAGRPAADSPAPAPEGPEGPKLSLVVVWEESDPNAFHASFPYFISSIRANSPLLELVLIWIHPDHMEDCGDPLGAAGVSPAGVEEGDNVRLVCLSRREHWEAHRDYFCAPKRWDCQDEEGEVVLRTMMQRGEMDWYKSFFKIYRAYVFAKYLSPGVDWWGWADFDTVMGNYLTQFPWEAKSYDVLIPATPDDTLLFLRSHLAFFSCHPETEQKLLMFPNLASPEIYVERHKPGEFLAIEESEYSAFIIRNPDISFLILPEAMAHIPVHLFTASTLKYYTPGGVFRTSAYDPPTTPSISSMPVLDLLPLLTTSPPARLFSPKGITRPVSIFAGSYEYGLWFPLEFATHYNHFHPVPEGWRRIVGRGGGYRGGEEGVWERLEPPREARGALPVGGEGEAVQVVEGMYLHWFEEKWNGGTCVSLSPSSLPAFVSLPAARLSFLPSPPIVHSFPPAPPSTTTDIPAQNGSTTSPNAHCARPKRS
ncbi:hypothetical protein CALVIDRAFT_79554 [Calocera viscosa TUFC12733]|uniref:Uncharacterized protein n=1 Tax=Calocera viscosa (strain TUFC12733) TaxID=1330018 RepID=A0A167N0F5_CALVF|nr:hypothetical protein CALVIDRAFT_79554 [Calocera viscosa TUFC12733]